MRVSIAAVICAAGSSERMGYTKKEYLPLPGKEPLSVLGAAVSAFASCNQVELLVITLPPGEENTQAEAALDSLPSELRDRSRLHFVAGGQTRRASVHKALLHLEEFKPSLVLIHDGARPWVTQDLIERTIQAAIKYRAVIPALPLSETPKEVSGTSEKFVERHLKRAKLYSAQTPQAFAFPEILIAHEKARAREENEHIEYTDDAEVWGEFIGPVAVIDGETANKKITYPEDLTGKAYD